MADDVPLLDIHCDVALMLVTTRPIDLPLHSNISTFFVSDVPLLDIHCDVALMLVTTRPIDLPLHSNISTFFVSDVPLLDIHCVVALTLETTRPIDLPLHPNVLTFAVSDVPLLGIHCVVALTLEKTRHIVIPLHPNVLTFAVSDVPLLDISLESNNEEAQNELFATFQHQRHLDHKKYTNEQTSSSFFVADYFYISSDQHDSRCQESSLRQLQTSDSASKRKVNWS
ncbi:hypothetical protein J6590_030352 [Homalodisca vitripennis]|nr:hypothetical protein J6590_030352 [Homalodisca vitripennis]